jgi:hypothetical protein
MITRKAFQQAFLTFANVNDIKRFHKDTWSHTLLQESVRILPLDLSEEDRAHRKQFGSKLSGLPPNFNPNEASKMLDSLNAATCFIPRNPKNYKKVNYAFIAFKTEADRAKAEETLLTYEGRELFWCESEQTKTCNKCGDLTHFAAQCTFISKKAAQKKENHFQQWYKKFKPAQHKHDNKKPTQNQPRKNFHSYADAAKNPRTRPWNQRNINQVRNGTAAGGSLHNSKQQNKSSISNGINNDIKK